MYQQQSRPGWLGTGATQQYPTPPLATFKEYRGFTGQPRSLIQTQTQHVLQTNRRLPHPPAYVCIYIYVYRDALSIAAGPMCSSCWSTIIHCPFSLQLPTSSQPAKKWRYTFTYPGILTTLTEHCLALRFNRKEKKNQYYNM